MLSLIANRNAILVMGGFEMRIKSLGKIFTVVLSSKMFMDVLFSLLAGARFKTTWSIITTIVITSVFFVSMKQMHVWSELE